LHGFIDRQLRDIAQTRFFLSRPRTMRGSTIDPLVAFHSLGDMLAYAPRALQIAMLSPFPSIWLEGGRKATSTGLRLAVIPETVAAYVLLVGLPAFLWGNRRRPVPWLILFVCLGMLLFYGIAVPNAGAIQRFRFPYYLPLVCMGLAGWLQFFAARRSKTATLPPA
jgi:hypothetical protein